MRLCFVIALCICLSNCRQSTKNPTSNGAVESLSKDDLSYDAEKDSINISRNILYRKYFPLSEKSEEITNFWVRSIGIELYSHWKNTPWDFNGTANRPEGGAIACGYFVTTILRDMDYKLDRNKLAICASSVMMKALTPFQKIKNISSLSYTDFNDTLSKWGKGVYIIGLDFHTGFIINDGLDNWFIHSNYIKRKGVSKELVLNSSALRSSKTRWLVSLTNDNNFLNKWLKGQG